MATVRLSFTPAPAHVRTARLVGVAVARQAGVKDAIIDEIRLAIGEACSRAVALHRRHGLPDLVEVELSDEGHFTVRVTDRAPADPGIVAVAEGPDTDPDRTDPFGLLRDASRDASAGSRRERLTNEATSDEDVAAGVALTLLAGLVEDLTVETGADGIGSRIRMSWPSAHTR
jgi:anti-sigma regulatory factor (Ser/Thr protein kinase)